MGFQLSIVAMGIHYWSHASKIFLGARVWSIQKHILLQYLTILWTCAQECIHTISQKRTYLGISATNSPLPLMVSHGRLWFLGGMRLFSWGAAIYKYEIMTIGYYWILLDTIGYYWILLDTIGYYWILLGQYPSHSSAMVYLSGVDVLNRIPMGRSIPH